MAPVALLLMIAATEPTVGERITRGRAAFDALEFDLAALELTQAARDPRASDEERLEANLWAGAAQRVLGQDTDARLHFIYVLRRVPDAPPPSEFAPKIADFYALVREEIAAPPPRREVEPPPAPPTLLPALTAVTGGAIALVGAGVMAVGAQPFFAHDEARRQLLQAAADGADGTAAADAQVAARTSWESWGGPLVLGGAAAMTIGVVAAAVGGLWWAGGP